MAQAMAAAASAPVAGLGSSSLPLRASRSEVQLASWLTLSRDVPEAADFGRTSNSVMQTRLACRSSFYVLGSSDAGSSKLRRKGVRTVVSGGPRCEANEDGQQDSKAKVWIGRFAKPSPFGNSSATSSIRDSNILRVGRARASLEDKVKSSETASSEETQASTSNSDPPSLESPPSSTSNPFASGKISRIAAKQAGDSKPSMSASVAQKTALPKKPAVVKPPAVGQLSANAAAQLKVARQPSVFTVPTKPTDEKPSSPFAQPGSSKPTTPANPFRKAPLVPTDWEKAGARAPGSGKRVLDAFKEGEKEGNTTKFGQPLVPTNIFDEVRRTPEEIAADAFKFEINPGQILLASSFLVVIAIMFGTVFLVWKVGAIHYNEY